MLDVWLVLVLTLPVLALISGAVFVIVVALCKAVPSDIPSIMTTACAALSHIADGLRRHNGWMRPDVMSADPTPRPPITGVSSTNEDGNQ